MITGSNNPFACTPVVVGTNNAILALGAITRVDNAFTFGVGFQWRINSIVYANNLPFVLTIEPAAEGFKRIDVAVLNQANQIELLSGQPSTTVALRPTIPLNTILLTSWNVDGTTVGSGSEPVIGNQFVKKQEFSKAVVEDAEATLLVLPLLADGQKYIEVNNTVEDVEVVGFDANIIISTDPNIEKPYPGKLFFVENTGNQNLILKHDLNTFEGVLFELPNDTDLILPPKAVAVFRYQLEEGNGFGSMKYILSSWQPTKQDKTQIKSSSFTAELDQVYHTVTTCTISDPTPFEGKGYVVRVINGTTTIAGTDYIPGQIVVRTFHSGSWLTFVYGKYGKVTTNTSVSGTYNIDLASDVDTYNLTLTGATTFTISNAPTGDKVRIITMRITGNHAITWWSGVNPIIVANYVGTEINKVVVEAFSGIYDVQLTQI